MQALINYIKQFTALDKDAEEAIIAMAEKRTFKKNEFILKQGQYCNHLWFLNSGMVRKFNLFDGNEETAWIHCENEVFTSMPAYINQIPSEEYLLACEDSEVIAISRATSEYLGRFPQVELFAKKLIESNMVALDCIGKRFTRMNALEKYQTLKEMSPEMIKRAKLGHIASIMGVTQETLSRIRAKK